MEILTSLETEIRVLEMETEYQGHYYRVSHVLIILVCGLLCGLQKTDDIYEWSESAPARGLIKEYFGVVSYPCRAQFYNILGTVDAKKFNAMFIQWMSGILKNESKGKTISLDGKEVRSVRKLNNNKGLNIVSAVIAETNIIVGSAFCEDKKGEVTAFRELINLLDVTGAVIVADALHCKKKSAEIVIDAGADYLFVVKDNEPTLKAEIEEIIHTCNIDSVSVTEKNGGRNETRTAYSTTDISLVTEGEKWANLASVGAIHRSFESKGAVSDEWHYYISSAELQPDELLHHARMEWRVESMHWLLDVHYNEDKCGMWDLNTQKLMNIGRKIALNLARIFKENCCKPRTAISTVLKRNLYDTSQLAGFLDYFIENPIITSS